jgi:hypothetical protein
LIVHYTDEPYRSDAKSTDLGALAFRNQPPPGGMVFSSRLPQTPGKGNAVEGIPTSVDDSIKNFVIEDSTGVVIFVMYKIGEKTCSCQSVAMITPLIAFACGIAIAVGFK